MAGNPDYKKDKQAADCSKPLFTNFLHGGTSGLLTTLPTLVVFPVYKTIFRQQIYNASICHTVAHLKMEGLLKLYRGVLPPLLQRTLNSTVLFGVQGTLHRQLTTSSQTVLPSYALPALAGLATGVVEALVLTPFERIQNLLQNNQNDKSLPKMRSILFELNNHRLATGYYRAFVPIVVRNALGSTLYFGMKEPIYDAMHAQGLPPVVASFASGTLSSWPITLIVFPMSVLVANMQKNLEGEVKGAMACWRILWDSRKHSVRQLYRGGSLVILRSCISWGVTTALYDWQQRRQA